MKMDTAETLKPAEPLVVSEEVYQQIGTITRLMLSRFASE